MRNNNLEYESINRVIIKEEEIQRQLGYLEMHRDLSECLEYTQRIFEIIDAHEKGLRRSSEIIDTYLGYRK